MTSRSRTFSKRKIFSRTPRVGSKQNMMDLILSERDPNTHQNDRQNPDVEQNIPNKSDKSSLHHEMSSEFPSEKVGRQTTIMAVLNRPKKSSLMQDLYSIFQDYIAEQRNAHGSIDVNVIEETSFGLYVSAVNQTYSVYKKNNERRLRKMKQKDKVDTRASLMKCYDIVPKEYLSRENYFNFEIFADSFDKIIKIQENLGQYMDLIEVNLHYQITERFQEFLDVILKINQMEAQIENALYEIKFFRGFNQMLKQDSKQNVLKISKLQKRKINIQSTLELLIVIHLVNKLSKKEKELTKNEDLELKAKLVKAMKQADKDKLHQIRLLKEVNFISKQIKVKIQEQFASEFQERCFNYLKPALLYRKVTKPKSVEDSLIFEDAAFEETYIDTQASVEEIGDYSHIPWVLNNLPRDTKAEDAIANVVLEYAGIGSFPSPLFREELLNLLKTFHKQFVSDMNEYQKDAMVKVKEKYISEMKNALAFRKYDMLDLRIKFAFLYLGIFKQFTDKYLILNCKIFQKLIDYYVKKIANKVSNFSVDGKRVNIEDRETLLFNQTIQNFCTSLSSVFDYFSERVAELTLCCDRHTLSIRQFLKIDSVFGEMLDIVGNQLKVQERLENSVPCKDTQINNHLTSLISPFNDRLGLKKMRELRVQTNKEFILSYHKRQINVLKESLDEELWVPATIPYSFGTVLESLLNEDKISEKDLESAELSQSQGLPEMASPEEGFNSTQKLDDTEQHADVEKAKKNASFDIKRHTLTIFGQDFKIVPSLLQLMKIISDYFNIQHRFKLIEIDAVSKIFGAIEFYNSMSRQIILQEHATSGKEKKIKAKNISLSLNSIVLLENLMDPIYQKIINGLKDSDLGWLSLEFTKTKQNLNNHINQLSLKLHNVLETKLLQQCNELEQMDWGVEEKINIPTKQSANILHTTWQFYRVVEEDLLQGHMVDLFKNILTDIKDHYLKIFKEAKIENPLAAKRITDELKYFSENIHQIPIYNNLESGFYDFEQKVSNILKKIQEDFPIE